jgi:hypothetical protein
MMTTFHVLHKFPQGSTWFLTAHSGMAQLCLALVPQPEEAVYLLCCMFVHTADFEVLPCSYVIFKSMGVVRLGQTWTFLKSWLIQVL